MERKAIQHSGVQTRAGERITVPAEVLPYRVGFVGGIIAGVVMTLVMAGWGALTGRGIWFPVNLIAATVLPDLQAASFQTLAQFNPAGALIGTLIHFTLSIGLGFVFALLLPTLPGSTFLWALAIGPILWFTAQYLALPLINPRMEALVHTPSFAIAHVMYSLTLGWWTSRASKIACCEPGTVGIRQMFLGY